MEKRQKFTAEFKREAVRLLNTGGKPAAVVARELGISHKTGVSVACSLGK